MEISKQVIDVLDNLCEKIGITIDWSQKNVMPYLQELFGKYVKYEMVTSIIWMVIGIVAAILAWKVIKRIYNSNDISDEIIFIGVVALGFLGATMLIVAIYQIFNIATCMTFPEKLILDELIKLAA